MLRNAYAAHMDRLPFAGGGQAAARGALRDASSIEQFDAKLRALAPTDDRQRALKTHAERVIEELAQARWVDFEQFSSTTPTAFLVVLV